MPVVGKVFKEKESHSKVDLTILSWGLLIYSSPRSPSSSFFDVSLAKGFHPKDFGVFLILGCSTEGRSMELSSLAESSKSCREILISKGRSLC